MSWNALPICFWLGASVLHTNLSGVNPWDVVGHISVFGRPYDTAAFTDKHDFCCELRDSHYVLVEDVKVFGPAVDIERSAFPSNLHPFEIRYEFGERAGGLVLSDYSKRLNDGWRVKFRHRPPSPNDFMEHVKLDIRGGRPAAIMPSHAECYARTGCNAPHCRIKGTLDINSLKEYPSPLNVSGFFGSFSKSGGFRGVPLHMTGLGHGSFGGNARGIGGGIGGTIRADKEDSLPHADDGERSSKQRKPAGVQSDLLVGGQDLFGWFFVGAMISGAILSLAAMVCRPHDQSRKAEDNQKHESPD